MIGNDFMKVVSKSKNVDRTIVFLIVILRKRPWHIFFCYFYTTKILLEDHVDKILAQWRKKKNKPENTFQTMASQKMRSWNNLYKCFCLYQLRKEFRILFVSTDSFKRFHAIYNIVKNIFNNNSIFHSLLYWLKVIRMIAIFLNQNASKHHINAFQR